MRDPTSTGFDENDMAPAHRSLPVSEDLPWTRFVSISRTEKHSEVWFSLSTAGFCCFEHFHKWIDVPPCTLSRPGWLFGGWEWCFGLCSTGGDVEKSSMLADAKISFHFPHCRLVDLEVFFVNESFLFLFLGKMVTIWWCWFQIFWLMQLPALYRCPQNWSDHQAS